MSIRNELLSQVLVAYGGTVPPSPTRNQLLDLIAKEIDSSSTLLSLTESGLLSDALDMLGGSSLSAQGRNELLNDIVIASGGTVRNPNDRNMLIEDWILSASPVTPPEVATITPQTFQLTDAGAGLDNTGTITPDSIDGETIDYVGSDGDDLLVIDLGGNSVGDSIGVAIDGVGSVSCVWNAITLRYEALFVGIALALRLLIGIATAITFTVSIG